MTDALARPAERRGVRPGASPRAWSDVLARAPRRLPHLRIWRAHPWRSTTGLVLFAFVLTHYLNHALGLVSLEAMEGVQVVRRAAWRSPPGTILLYGALAIHAALALASVLGRRTWRIPPAQVAQTLLGLAIPILLVGHVAATRGTAALAGVGDDYGAVLPRMWPWSAAWQTALLLVVWVHGCLGLHRWLGERAWYRAAAPALLAGAVLVPALAGLGWIEAARRLALAGVAPSWPALPPAVAAMPDRATLLALVVVGGTILLALGLRLREGLHRGPLVTYAEGRRVRVRPGATLLEAGLSAGIPHASVCGGRGRCTTCRVAVLAGLDELAAPNPTEAAALARVGAPPGIRLACQVRPQHALRVRRLVPAARAEAASAAGDAFRWGAERRITVMFADLRGFTTLAERLYPYDSVFLLNRYFELMAEAVERRGGHVDKFLGDGIMALFGTAERISPDAGAGAALRAACDMVAALGVLNEEFDTTLGDPLRMGLGLHTGPAVVGRIGGRSTGTESASLTALGDSVNIASRLEALNKEFGTTLVVSQATLEAAGVQLPGAEAREVPVRGRREGLRVAVARDVEGLRAALAGGGPVATGAPARADRARA